MRVDRDLVGKDADEELGALNRVSTRSGRSRIGVSADQSLGQRSGDRVIVKSSPRRSAISARAARWPARLEARGVSRGPSAWPRPLARRRRRRLSRRVLSRASAMWRQTSPASHLAAQPAWSRRAPCEAARGSRPAQASSFSSISRAWTAIITGRWKRIEAMSAEWRPHCALRSARQQVEEGFGIGGVAGLRKVAAKTVPAEVVPRDRRRGVVVGIELDVHAEARLARHLLDHEVPAPVVGLGIAVVVALAPARS